MLYHASDAIALRLSVLSPEAPTPTASNKEDAIHLRMLSWHNRREPEVTCACGDKRCETPGVTALAFAGESYLLVGLCDGHIEKWRMPLIDAGQAGQAGRSSFG